MNANALVAEAYAKIKGTAPAGFEDKKLVSGLGFESIDVIDLLFEIEQASGIQIELGALLMHTRQQAERRFQDLTAQDIIRFINDQKK